MKDTQTITIILLAVTAIVLGALLITATPETAQASTSARQGNYLVASVRATPNRDLVYVVNVQLQGVIVYGLDVNKGEIVKVADMDLRKIFGK